MALRQIRYHGGDQHKGNSDRLPETTRKETQESNVIRGFSGSTYVSKTENKKVTVESVSLFGPTGNSKTPQHQFITSSHIAEPERSSKSYQKRITPDSQSLISANNLKPSNGFANDCEHRSLFGSDFGGSNNLRNNGLFERHTSDNKHVFAGSFSTTESKNFSSPRSATAYAGYRHKPTASKIDVHANFSNTGTEVHGKGMYNIDRDNALTASLAVNRRRRSFSSHGELAYQHNPTKSEVAVGFCNGNGGTDLTLRGQSKILKDRSRHTMDGSVLVKQRVGGPLGVDANLDYKHKPSNTHLTVGVMHHSKTTTVNTGINTKIKNKVSLGASSYYTETPNAKSVGFQVSGGF